MRGFLCAVFVDFCITVCITSAQGFGSGASQCMIHNFICLFPFADQNLTTTPKVHIYTHTRIVIGHSLNGGMYLLKDGT